MKKLYQNDFEIQHAITKNSRQNLALIQISASLLLVYRINYGRKRPHKLADLRTKAELWARKTNAWSIALKWAKIILAHGRFEDVKHRRINLMHVNTGSDLYIAAKNLM